MSLAKRLQVVGNAPEGSVSRDPAIEGLRQRIHRQLIEELGPVLSDRDIDAADLRKRVLDSLSSALDAENGLAVTGLLRELARERGTTVLIASHDMRIAPFANRILQLNDGRL